MFITEGDIEINVDPRRHVVVGMDAADQERAAAIAIGRRARKKSNARDNKRVDSSNPFDEDTVGALCEIAFSKWSNLPVDETSLVGGDSGADFFIYENPSKLTTIDIKGYRKPLNLFMKFGTPERKCSNRYVLAGIEEGRRNVILLGSATYLQMISAEVRTFHSGLRIQNHFLPVKKLSPMVEIETLIEEGIRPNFDDPFWLEAA